MSKQIYIYILQKCIFRVVILFAMIFMVGGIAQTAQATITDVGNNRSLDSDTQLLWLDLSQTVGRSYNDVSTKLGVGQEFDGWRYATLAEVRVLLDHFGFPVYGSSAGYLDSYNQAISDFGSTLGLTFDNATARGFFSFVSDSGALNTQFNIRMRDSQLIDVIDLSLAFSNDETLPTLASFLVREQTDVPEPSLNLLLGGGLMGLGYLAYRRKKA